MSRFTNYDANAVSLICLAISVTDMRAPKGFVKITWPSDLFGETEGCDGGVARYAIGSKLGVGEVTILDASKHNQQFSALVGLDVTSQNGSGVGLFLLKDNNGATLIDADKCWIYKRPETTKGRETGERTWGFKFVVASQFQIIDGGN